MESINRIHLTGRVGRDAVLTFTETNRVAILKFPLATHNSFKHTDTDEWDESVTWHNCILWRSAWAHDLIRKGKAITVEGRVNNIFFKDAEGRKMYYSQVVVEKFVVLGDGAQWTPIDHIGMQGRPERKLVKGLTPEVPEEELPF